MVGRHLGRCCGRWLPFILSAGLGMLMIHSLAAAQQVDFQRDVRPILSDRCFTCHGLDGGSRQAGLRLDRFDDATSEADSGEIAIVPFAPDESELMRRITSLDPGLRMPPEETGDELSPEEVETLRRWIAAGATYAEHWAWRPPATPAIPEVRNWRWSRNVVDWHVLHQLEQEGLEPRPEVDAARLLRRVSLDLTGLPPSPVELAEFLDAFARDGDRAYEAEVERLLSSPHFGERMALDWLDAARYADTNGYFGDKPRQMWPWRDWVIRAFNANMPFDQFTIKQLAGDLLPEATRDQRIATGFHRNSMANNETGIIDEEYRVEAIADRVETTGTVWLGMTIGCAQCHDHKFDPISQREYYRLFAFFNQSVESGLVTRDDPPPVLEVPTPEQEAELEHRTVLRGQAEAGFKAREAELEADLQVWSSQAIDRLEPLPEDSLIWCRLEPPPGEEGGEQGNVDGGVGDDILEVQAGVPVDNRSASEALLTQPRVVGTYLTHERGIRGEAGKFEATQHLEIETEFDADAAWTISVWCKPSSSLGCLWSKIEPTDRRRGTELIWQKGKFQLNLVHHWGADEITVTTQHPVATNQWHHIVVSYDGGRKASGLRIFVDGRLMPLTVLNDRLHGTLHNEEPLRMGRRDSGLGYYGLLDEFRILARESDLEVLSSWSDTERLLGILERSEESRSAEERSMLRDYYVTHQADLDLRAAYQRWQQALADERAARHAIPTTLVMQDRDEPRPTYLLLRGEYDKLGEEVRPGVPDLFPPLPEDAPPNRLALAHWLVSDKHPLTARVAVNRLWKICFGEGLVRTPRDFGIQGELPIHPELLDALAVRFVDTGWDVKGMLRTIVTSATYRQSSQASDELLRRDPENRLLARGPRFRLPAELVRDQALAVSGLLSRKVGGPSVKPYQPEGLWEEVSYNAEDSYLPDSDDGLWRRSIYTYWKRQAPPPALLTFDANTREKCVVQRSRTNTPLQALVLLNDVTYVEAARVLARAIVTPEVTDRPANVTGQGHGVGADIPFAGASDGVVPGEVETGDLWHLKKLFRRVISRDPRVEELGVLHDLLEVQRVRVSAQPDEAARLAGAADVDGFGSRTTRDVMELAAWTLVAQTILNLDEAITRR
jgi:hypothetical protein